MIKLWANETSRDLSLRWVSDGYPGYIAQYRHCDSVTFYLPFGRYQKQGEWNFPVQINNVITVQIIYTDL